MGKNHRHKKNLKSDKAKVKLKQTKTNFLPKGLNETKATFKIKPIVIREQLKETSTDIPLGIRKLNIKALCSRINHYNENIRCTACEELAEMFKRYSEEIVKENISEVILNVSNLMQDRERKVRNAAVKVVAIILQTTPGEKLEPFFKYFSTNMRCAMTNIDRNIQEDSLKFLDCFLLKDCGFISKASAKLLPDFLTLISRLRVENNLSHTLTLNLGSKMTSVTWRIKVLSRLHVLLDLLLNKNDTENKNLHSSAQSCNTFPIYKNSFYQALNNPIWCISEDSSLDKNVLDSHLSGLIPIFYDIWLEVVPHKKTQKSVQESTSLDDEASAIFSSVVNTMYLLWKYIEKTDTTNSDLKNIFVSTEATKFLTHLLANFPYTQSDNLRLKNQPKSNALSLELNGDPKCVRENIIICYIYFVLNANFTRMTAKSEMECISMYINKCLLTKNYVDHNSIKYVIEFIEVCLLEKCYVWKKSNIDARQILENVMTFYNSGTISEKNEMKLFAVFANLVDNPYLSKSLHYHSWLSSLPELLCRSQINESVIEILLQLARKNSFHFLNAMRSNMSRILKNFKSLTIVCAKNSYKEENMLKREIAFIFYYIKELTCFELKELLQYFSIHISKEDCSILRDQLHKCGDDCLNL